MKDGWEISSPPLALLLSHPWPPPISQLPQLSAKHSTAKTAAGWSSLIPKRGFRRLASPPHQLARLSHTAHTKIFLVAKEWLEYFSSKPPWQKNFQLINQSILISIFNRCWMHLCDSLQNAKAARRSVE